MLSTVIWLVILLIILCFGGTLIFGAPYLPTLHKQIGVALELANLKSGQMLLELGCGDGRVALQAVKLGYKVIGYEINPLLVIVAKWRTRHYRKLVVIRWKNFLTTDWPPAQAVFVFGLDRLMPKIDRKIKTDNLTTRLVSFTFKISGKVPIAVRDGVFAYDYK